jgi:hypothetical protein
VIGGVVRAKALFKIIDINSDGTLDIDELSAAFSDVTTPPLFRH